MNMYFVSAGFRYVLVDARNKEQARTLAMPKLIELYADMLERFGSQYPINIHTVREATPEEVELWRWHHEMIRKDAERRNLNE